MSFGHHTRLNPAELDAKLASERDQLVVTLRGLANRVEHAPVACLKDGLVAILFAVEPLVRAIDRAAPNPS
jgi:hypothetical protein